MDELTFDKLADEGLDDGDQGDVFGNHLADALALYIETFGADRPVRVSFVLEPEDDRLVRLATKGSDGELEPEAELGEPYLLLGEEDQKPCGVKVDICAMPPIDLSDQDEEEAALEN